MKRIHYFSGFIITVFVFLHLFNHLYSFVGVESHIELMNSLRVVYRNVIVESVLLLAVLFQIISGIRLFIKKVKQVSNFFEKLQVWSGLYLALFFLIHLSAVLGGRFILELDTNFYFGAAGLNTFPFNLFFIPYYGLAIVSFFGHISAVHALKMKGDLFGVNSRQQAFVILGLGVVLTGALFYGLTNGFQGVLIPEDYMLLIGE